MSKIDKILSRVLIAQQEAASSIRPDKPGWLKEQESFCAGAILAAKARLYVAIKDEVLSAQDQTSLARLDVLFGKTEAK